MTADIERFVQLWSERAEVLLADQLHRQFPSQNVTVRVNVEVQVGLTVDVKSSISWPRGKKWREHTAEEVTEVKIVAALGKISHATTRILLSAWKDNHNAWLGFRKIEQMTRCHPPSAVSMVNSDLKKTGVLMAVKADRHGGMANEKSYALVCVAPLRSD